MKQKFEKKICEIKIDQRTLSFFNKMFFNITSRTLMQSNIAHAFN